MRRYVSCAAVALLCCCAVFGQSNTALAPEIDKILETSLQLSRAPSISVAVVQDGQLVYANAVGQASLDPERKASPATRYAVGSVSKQFTAAAILLAAEQGKLSLDDPVSKFYPDLTRAREITLRELLSHTSGYEDYAPQDYIIPEWTKPTSPDETLGRWAKKPLNFDPGTKWQYSNTNFVLAGRIFEKASGEQLLPFLRRKIFDPLGMKSAGDCFVDHSTDDAMAYTRYALGPPRPAEREAPGWYFAAGELCLTPSDLAQWDIAFLKKQILSGDSYRQFTTEVKLKNGNATHYALGLELGEIKGVPEFYHGGEVSGFLTENAVFPTKNAAVVVCSNQDGTQVVSGVYRQIAELLVSPAKPASAEELSQIRGILRGLAHGQIDRDLFTPDANFYFKDVTLRDYKKSLDGLGELKNVTRTNESPRGGMIHRSYRAEYQKKTLVLNVYVTQDGKYEQLLVEQSF